MQDVATSGGVDRYLLVHPTVAEHFYETTHLGHRVVRRTQADRAKPHVGRGAQAVPGRSDFVGPDPDFSVRWTVTEGGLKRWSLRRTAHDVEHPHAARGGRRCAEGLESILGDGGGKADEYGNGLAGQRSEQAPDDWIEDVSIKQVFGHPFDPDDHGGQSIGIEVQAGSRSPAGQRTTEVDEVAVPVGPGP